MLLTPPIQRLFEPRPLICPRCRKPILSPSERARWRSPRRYMPRRSRFADVMNMAGGLQIGTGGLQVKAGMGLVISATGSDPCCCSFVCPSNLVLTLSGTSISSFSCTTCGGGPHSTKVVGGNIDGTYTVPYITSESGPNDCDYQINSNVGTGSHGIPSGAGAAVGTTYSVLACVGSVVNTYIIIVEVDINPNTQAVVINQMSYAISQPTDPCELTHSTVITTGATTTVAALPYTASTLIGGTWTIDL